MMGFVKYGFTYAFHFLKIKQDFETAIIETMCQGGDTDTNACIVGGLMGALYGYDGLPEHALKNLLSCQTNQGSEPRAELFEIALAVKNLDILCAV